jgi:hypothetical protein
MAFALMIVQNPGLHELSPEVSTAQSILPYRFLSAFILILNR